MTDDNDVYTPAQFREHQSGFGFRDPKVHRHTGFVRDKRISRFLSVFAENYDPTETERPDQMPGQYDGTKEVREIERIGADETALEALNGGDMPRLKHMTGDMNQRADVSGMKAIDGLRDEMTGPAPMFYIWAEPGTGKTDFAFLLAQQWKREHGENALVASNVRTLMESDPWPVQEVVDRHDLDLEPESHDGWIPNFGKLKEWIEQDGNPEKHGQRPKLFIFDEASSSAGGGGNSGWQAKSKMGPMAYKIRKYNGALIVIGHDGKDVHPLIRELGVAIHKEGLKDATFYDDVQNRKGVGERMRVTGIPPTDWRFDTAEATSWSWSTPEEEEEEITEKEIRIGLAIRHRLLEHSTADTAEFVGMSTGWVSSRWQEYNQDGEHRETMNKLSEIIE